jgi:two-component system chemotaxis response regulator CheY
MTILVVDDVALMRKILTNMLVQQCGIQKDNVYEAADGAAAVAVYKKHKPDIVFLDVLMPKQNGTETVADLIKADSEAYIIMCSAAGERAIVKDCVRAGAKDYIIKPLDPDRVKIALKKGGLKEDLEEEAVKPGKTEPKAEKESSKDEGTDGESY